MRKQVELLSTLCRCVDRALCQTCDQPGMAVSGRVRTPCNFCSIISGPQGQCPRISARLMPMNSSLLAALGGKTISFVGDSMVRQQYWMVVCMLSAQIEQAEHRYWECPTWDCANRFSRVVIRDTVTESRIVLQNQWFGDTRVVEQPRLFTDAHIILFGIGAFLQPVEDEVQRTIVAWRHEWLDHVQQRGGMVIWLEYFGGHFNSSNGDYEGFEQVRQQTRHAFVSHGARRPRAAQGVRQGPTEAQGDAYPCVPMDRVAVHNAHTNPRYAVGNRMARISGWPILHTLEQSVPYSVSHLGVKDNRHWWVSADVEMSVKVIDCRHWCFPSAVLEKRVLRMVDLLEHIVT